MLRIDRADPFVLLPVVLLLGITAHAQPAQNPGIAPPASASAKTKAQLYADPQKLNLSAIVPDPPAAGSPELMADLAELHRIQQSRTPAQVAAAKTDEAQESIFAFSTVLGEGFSPEALPVTAALGEIVKDEQSAAGKGLKADFARARPYQADATLHPVCAVTGVHNSYPSGHALTGYLEAFTLAEILPEKRAAILARADQYAHNRLVCGVHYPSDIEASRRVAYAVFGDMMTSPRFQHDLQAAREEIKAALK